jgi:hypothetical protein
MANQIPMPANTPHMALQPSIRRQPDQHTFAERGMVKVSPSSPFSLRQQNCRPRPLVEGSLLLWVSRHRAVSHFLPSARARPGGVISGPSVYTVHEFVRHPERAHRIVTRCRRPRFFGMTIFLDGFIFESNRKNEPGGSVRFRRGSNLDHKGLGSHDRS